MKKTTVPAIAATKAADKPIVTPTPAVGATQIVGENAIASGSPAGGVIPAGAPTAPAVSAEVPLPADQTAPADRPAVDPAGGVSAAALAVGGAGGASPSLVPDHPTVGDLTADDGAHATPATTVMERVPGTVPLPADQITPVAPATVAQTTPVVPRDVDTDRMRTAPEPDEERRLFPVAYDVDHDGKSYAPGKHVALTFDEHARLFRSTAVTSRWGDGLDPADLDVWRR